MAHRSMIRLGFAAAILSSSAAGVFAQEAGESWGTASGYSTVTGLQLVPAYEGLYLRPKWWFIGPYAPTGGVYCDDTTDSNGFAHAVAQFDLPEGALLETFHYWAYDASSEWDLLFTLWQVCQGPGDLSPSATMMAEGFTLGSPGDYYWSATLDGRTVNNKACAYVLEVRFGSGNGCPADEALQARKFAIQWKRQVSPAPATATFNDVATGHPFFQFVEALAKSGITGGCGGGSFCPDAPLTRGQMAVFLAKALGLQWP
jgi:S-layer homology domain